MNHSYVQSFLLAGGEELQELKALLKKHYEYTGSPRAFEILNNFETASHRFKKVTPESSE